MQKLRSYNYVFIGTVLEHLDNMLFVLYLPVLASFFFNTQDIEAKWFLAFISFGLYFLVRPIGALIFGVIGDKFGRKNALLGSVFMMSIATLSIGLLPSYKTIGITSSVFFMILRALQGLSVGGEYGAAMTYIYDNCAKDRRTFFGSLLIASTHLGGVIAAALALLGIVNFQYIFIGVGLVGIISLKGRMSLIDQYKSNPAKEYDAEFVSNEISKSFNRYFYVFALSSCLVAIFYTTIVYFSKISSITLGMTSQEIKIVNAILLSMWLLLSPLVGYVIDAKKLDPHSVMRFASASIMVFAPIVLVYFSYYGYSVAMFVSFQVILTMLHVMFCAPTPRLICGVFSNQLRNTNASLSYAIGSSFTAGLVPIFNDYLYKFFGIKGIGILIFLFAFVGLMGCMNKEKR